MAELWIPDEKDRILINKGAADDALRKRAFASKSYVSMAEDAMVKLREEKTTLEELVRTLPFSSIYDFHRFQKMY